jgi:hypothetical protein
MATENTAMQERCVVPENSLTQPIKSLSVQVQLHQYNLILIFRNRDGAEYSRATYLSKH